MLSIARLKNFKLSGQYELFEKIYLMLSEVRQKFFFKIVPKMVISRRSFGCWPGPGGPWPPYPPLDPLLIKPI